MSLLERLRKRLSTYPAASGTEPAVFFFGHQKSGTTAIAALFAELVGEPYHHDLFYTHGWLDNHEVFTGSLGAAELAARAPKAFSRGVTKDPDFTFAMPQIVEAHPTSPAIFIIREPKAMIASILGRLSIPGNAEAIGGHLDGLKPVERTLWGNILDCERQGLPPGNHIAALSHRWHIAAELYARCEGRCLLLRYEDFRSDKKGSLEALATSIGREMRNDISHRVDKKFQPRSKRPDSFLDFFGDQNFEIISSICDSRAKEFGYAND